MLYCIATPLDLGKYSYFAGFQHEYFQKESDKLPEYLN